MASQLTFDFDDDDKKEKASSSSSDTALPDLLPKSWRELLEPEFSKPYFGELEEFLTSEYSEKEIFPERDNLFSAFNLATLDSTKVLLLGQDPYHDNGQAHGLSFSVLPGVKIPPSLRNMYKELQSDLDIEPPEHGQLVDWAKQGILMLNAILSVEAHKAGSHKKKGWEQFTDAVIQTLSDRSEPIVFLLWGGFAKKKTKLIDASRHVIIEGAHPSPLSAHNGFFGSKPYSEVNAALEKLGHEPIDWRLSS